MCRIGIVKGLLDQELELLPFVSPFAAADGRLFRGARGGPLSESFYGRTWHQALTAAMPRSPAIAPLRPYDLRHAALSLWLASGAPPADIAARAGHSVHVLLATYAHCLPGYGQIATAHIDRALHASGPPLAHTSGHYPARSRPSCVRATTGPNGTPRDLTRPAESKATPVTSANTDPAARPGPLQRRSTLPGTPPAAGRGPARIWPTTGPQPPGTVYRTAPEHATGPASGTPGPGLTWGFMWQVLGSNQRRLSRRFYSQPIPTHRNSR